MIANETSPKNMTFEELVAEYEKFLYLKDDPDLLRLLFGAMIANRAKGLPIWVILVAKSSSGKSEILMSFRDIPGVVSVSTMTGNSFLSAYGNDSEVGLLAQLRGNNKMLVIKDMTTLSEMGSDERNKIFGILRDAYDGYCERATGKGMIRFEGKFGIIAAGTPAIERSRKNEAILGERFIHIRSRINSEKIIEYALKNMNAEVEMRQTLKAAATRFMDELPALPDQLTLPRSATEVTMACAKALVRARASVIREAHSKEITFPTEINEIPVRVYKQINLMLVGMRHIGSSTDDLIRCARRIMIDTIPYDRLCVLKCIYMRAISTGAIAKSLGMSVGATSKIIEDLRVLGVIRRISEGGNRLVSSDEEYEIVIEEINQGLKDLIGQIKNHA